MQKARTRVECVFGWLTPLLRAGFCKNGTTLLLMNNHTKIKTIVILTLLTTLIFPAQIFAWGAHGHTVSGKAAAVKLPKEMPKFFRNASDQLAYLNPEPDRWRDRAEAETNPTTREAFNPDHYINFERVTEAALNAENRFQFLALMRANGSNTPEGAAKIETGAEAGLSPFRIMEMFGRLRTEFRLWRTTTDKREKRWIQERIINDAGILGHYVTDGANPHHTTIHHHGWIGDNPKSYATDREFHARFEGAFVRSRIGLNDLLPKINQTPRVVTNPRQSVIEFLRTSHNQVERLYEIDKRAAFNETTTAPENKEFAAQRLAAGAEMLRDLWWTAWVTSASTANAARSES